MNVLPQVWFWEYVFLTVIEKECTGTAGMLKGKAGSSRGQISRLLQEHKLEAVRGWDVWTSLCSRCKYMCKQLYLLQIINDECYNTGLYMGQQHILPNKESTYYTQLLITMLLKYFWVVSDVCTNQGRRSLLWECKCRVKCTWCNQTNVFFQE